jgi:hypothetical protein
MAPVSYPPSRRWRSRPHATVWAACVVGHVAFSVWLAAATVGDIRRVVGQPPPSPPEVTRDVVVRHVPDREGRQASFRILLFSDEFSWRLGSFDEVEDAPSPPAFTPQMKDVLATAREIIVVGASSEELPKGVTQDAGRAHEERRAARRADRIAQWVLGALPSPVPVRKLNVGYHAPTSRSGPTSDQRRVVIVLVLENKEGANMDEALRAAMLQDAERTPIFETLLTRYSLSSGSSFTWVP